VDYDADLLRIAGLERDLFPDLLRAVDILGPITPEVADDIGLSRRVQVVMGTPDIPAAAIGSGAVNDFSGNIYIGTSSWLTCHVPYKKTDILHNIASLPSAIPGRYIVVNEQETAGACLSFLRDNVVYHKDELVREADVADTYRLFDRIADRVPAGSDKLIFTPWLYGERTPVEDHSVRSCLFNISLRTTREHIIRAVFEGVAFNTRWLLSTVERFVKRPLDNLRMIGGGASSAVWCQIHADVLNRTIRQIEDPILANLRGSGLLGAVALGYLRFEDIPDIVAVAGTFRPNPDNRAIYNELYREFLNIYKRNKPIFARLNRQG
jgi:xylulokinase